MQINVRATVFVEAAHPYGALRARQTLQSSSVPCRHQRALPAIFTRSLQIVDRMHPPRPVSCCAGNVFLCNRPAQWGASVQRMEPVAVLDRNFLNDAIGRKIGKDTDPSARLILRKYRLGGVGQTFQHHLKPNPSNRFVRRRRRPSGSRRLK